MFHPYPSSSSHFGDACCLTRCGPATAACVAELQLDISCAPWRVSAQAESSHGQDALVHCLAERQGGSSCMAANRLFLLFGSVLRLSSLEGETCSSLLRKYLPEIFRNMFYIETHEASEHRDLSTQPLDTTRLDGILPPYLKTVLFLFCFRYVYWLRLHRK